MRANSAPAAPEEVSKRAPKETQEQPKSGDAWAAGPARPPRRLPHLLVLFLLPLLILSLFLPRVFSEELPRRLRERLLLPPPDDFPIAMTTQTHGNDDTVWAGGVSETIE